MWLERRAPACRVYAEHVSSGHDRGKHEAADSLYRCHWGHNVALQPKDDYRHRTARRQFHAFMGTAAAMSRHEHVQDVETRRFLLRVLRKPETFWRQIRKCVQCGMALTIANDALEKRAR